MKYLTIGLSSGMGLRWRWVTNDYYRGRAHREHVARRARERRNRRLRAALVVSLLAALAVVLVWRLA